MKNDSAPAAAEMDVLKLFIWFMLVLALGLVGFYVYLRGNVESTTANLATGTKLMKEFQQDQAEIEGMLAVYKNNKEEDARWAPMTWFSTIWNRVGINANSLQPGKWREPPRLDSKGKFYEEQFDIVINPKAPLPREQIARLCHEIEKSSARLRILELHIDRADNKEGLEKDEWKGKISIGYRYAKTD